MLRVADTGTGIAPDQLPLIFNRFHRVEGAEGRTHEGTGIGLALVDELARLHKGSVRVESRLGEGTIFTVRIPFGSAHLPQAQVERQEARSSTATRADAFVSEALRWLPGTQVEEQGGARPEKTGHILIADDNADMRDYVSRILSAHHHVVAVADGEAALAAIAEHRPDLVLTDIMMPRLDGIGLLTRIKSHPSLRDLPVILLSARAGEDAKVEGLRHGADDYLVKPFSARELLSRVAAHLRLASLRRDTIDTLRHQAAQFETLFNQAPMGVFIVDADFCLRSVNPMARAVFGDAAGEVEGRDFDEIIHIVWPKPFADAVVKVFRHTAETGESYVSTETAETRADRQVTEHYEWRVDRIRQPDGRFGAVCYFRDVSERARAEATRQLLINELNHRVKNTLATVQAVAQQTLRHSKEPGDFAALFSGRINSMARIHAMLTEARWHGADLKDLILDQLLHGPVEESKVVVNGPSVYLSHQSALSLALMLHELATNSAKYGALSAPSGRVSVTWSVRGDMLGLKWVERGGPPVAAPTRRGFGTILMEQSAKSEKGAATALYESEGVTWDISVSLRQPAEMEHSAAAAPLRSPAQAQAGARLSGLRLLVVEDEAIIAMDIAERLTDCGAAHAATASSEEEALRLIGNERFDAALLDANLHGRPVDAIAVALTQRQIPFVFVTGYGREGLPDAFRHAALLAKPFGDRQLADAVAGLVSPKDNVVRLKP